MPLPYISLNPIEVLTMGDLPDRSQLRPEHFGGTPESLAAASEWIACQPGQGAWPLQIWLSVPSERNSTDPRDDNALALYFYPSWEVHSAPGTDPATLEGDEFSVPTPAPDPQAVADAITALLSAQYSLAFASYGIFPGKPEQLRLALVLKSELQASTLRSDAELRARLDGEFFFTLRKLCKQLGLAWGGYVITSQEQLKQTRRDPYDWKSTAPTPPFGSAEALMPASVPAAPSPTPAPMRTPQATSQVPPPIIADAPPEREPGLGAFLLHYWYMVILVAMGLIVVLVTSRQ